MRWSARTCWRSAGSPRSPGPELAPRRHGAGSLAARSSSTRAQRAGSPGATRSARIAAMWGCFRVGVLIVLGSGLAQTSVSLAGPAGPGPGASAAPGAPALRALDKPAFTATPAELLALGKAAPTGDGSMVVLREQRDVSYDDQGRATVRTRRVYVVQA